MSLLKFRKVYIGKYKFKKSIFNRFFDTLITETLTDVFSITNFNTQIYTLTTLCHYYRGEGLANSINSALLNAQITKHGLWVTGTTPKYVEVFA